MVQLPAATKANTQEAGVDVKESGFIQMLATWEMEELCHQAHLLGRYGIHVSKPTSNSQWNQSKHNLEVFTRRERGTEQFDQGRGLQSSLRASAQSLPMKQTVVWCASSWVHVIPALRHSGSMGEGQYTSGSWVA